MMNKDKDKDIRASKELSKIKSGLTCIEEGTTVLMCAPEIKVVEKRLKVLETIITKHPYLYCVRVCVDYDDYKDAVTDGGELDTLTEPEFYALKELYEL